MKNCLGIGLWLFPIIFLLGAGEYAYCAPVTFNNFLTADWVSLDTTMGNGFDGSVTIGTPISGSFTYDSELPDQDPRPEEGVYYPTGLFTATMGNYVFTTNYYIVIGNGAPGSDRFDLHFMPNSVLTNGVQTFTSDPENPLQVESNTGHWQSSGYELAEIFTTDALPVTAWDLTTNGSSSNSHFYIRFGAEEHSAGWWGWVSIDGYIDSFELAPVPIPASFLLLGSGIVGIAGIRRRFRKR